MLGRLFERATGGTLLDDVGKLGDEEIFHTWNRAQESRKPLLMVHETDSAHWKVALPDLRSRLMAASVVRIEEPDDALAIALLERLFLDRAIPVAPDLPAYLLPRIERSYAAIHRVVSEIDQASLAQKKRIGVRLAREILFDNELIGIARRPGGGPGRRGA